MIPNPEFLFGNEGIDGWPYELDGTPATSMEPNELVRSAWGKRAAAGEGPAGSESLERMARASDGVMKESDSSKATEPRV